MPREVFSITKSVTSTLVGIAVRDGDLRLDDRVVALRAAVARHAVGVVTVRNLLSNDSGRYWSLQSDYADLLRARSRTRYAVGLPQQYAPGTAWAYNNAAIQVLEAVLEEATGMPVARFARERLFEPLGMTHSTLHHRPRRRRGGLLRPADHLPRPGPLRLALPRPGQGRRTTAARHELRERAVGRSSTVHNAAYGYLWWLNRPGRLRGATDPVDAQGQPLRPVTGQLAPYAPEHVYAALGFGGQVLLVDPNDADDGGPPRRSPPSRARSRTASAARRPC